MSASKGGTGKQEGADLDVKAIALYVGVDGLCVSSDGQKCGLFPKYADREATHVIEKAKLKALARDLLDAGIEREREKAEPLRYYGGIPPISYDILILLDGRRIERTFFHAAGCQVPAKYIKILSAALEGCRDSTLAKFIKQNRALSEGTDEAPEAGK
jgi:hypothetical protein